jgi:hypothetical protein
LAEYGASAQFHFDTDLSARRRRLRLFHCKAANETPHHYSRAIARSFQPHRKMVKTSLPERQHQDFGYIIIIWQIYDTDFLISQRSGDIAYRISLRLRRRLLMIILSMMRSMMMHYR